MIENFDFKWLRMRARAPVAAKSSYSRGRMPYLIVHEPQRVAFSVGLREGLRVGRLSDADLVLADPHVSRQHVKFSLGPQGWTVVDIGSKHGTRVNGDLVEQKTMADGDQIKLGNSVLTFRTGDSLPQIVHQQPVSPETLPATLEEPGGQRLRILYEMSRAVSAGGDAEDLLRKLLRAILEILRCERGWIGLVDRHRAGLRNITWVRTLGQPGDDAVISHAMLDAILKRQVGIIARASSPGGWSMGVPLQSGGNTLGVIYVEDPHRLERFTPEDFDFLTALSHLTAAALVSNERFQRALRVAEAFRAEKGSDELLGDSEPIRELRAQIQKYAVAQDAPVLIQGETGTGKELVARILHSLSPRNESAWVPVNCAAIPESMIESELFGYEKGAFTGAAKDKRGKFALAQGGTLFLDEIGDLSPSAQAKVLRAIEEGEVQPLGSERTFGVDVRVVCATHKNLLREIQKKRFREDLYYRINAIELTVPPLRHRGGDIALLAEAFLKQEASRITPEALDALGRYRWPGNVRELKNEIERALITSEGSIIELKHLSPRLTSTVPSPDRPPIRTSLADELAELGSAEKKLVIAALSQSHGNLSEAARLLGISRVVMKRRVSRYGYSKTWSKKT